MEYEINISMEETCKLLGVSETEVIRLIKEEKLTPLIGPNFSLELEYNSVVQYKEERQ